MVQIIDENRRRTGGENFAEAFSGLINQYSQFQQQQQRAEALRGEGINPNLPEDIQKIQAQKLFSGEKQETPSQRATRELKEFQLKDLQGRQNRFNQLIGKGRQQNESMAENGMGIEGEEQAQSGFDIKNVPESALDEFVAFAGQPGEQGVIGNIAKAEKERRIDEKKEKRKEFSEERSFHTGYSKKAVEEVDELRNTIPKLQMSLDLARNAVESGDVSAFSLANIGKRLNIPELQTAKGSQLITAAKENLLSNMNRVSARAQNIWFEQRMNSMLPQIGQSPEANLSAQELLEGEVAMDQAYVNEFDRLSNEDMEKYGYERKDIKMRAQQAARTQQKHIFERTNYRLKELEEQEHGLDKLKKEVGKNVIPGTVLTLAMAKLYKDKFGDKAIDVIKKNGYKIPTLDEFKSYQLRPQEFREGL